MERDILKLDRQLNTLLDTLADTDCAHVTRAQERKIESEKLLADEKKRKTGLDPRSKSKKTELALELLSNPWKLWTSGIMEHRRSALKLAFADRLAYARNKGQRTPKNLTIQGVRSV